MILFFTILTAYSLAYIFAHWFCAFLERRVWKKPTVIEELKAIREEIAEARAMQDRTHLMFAIHGVDDANNKLKSDYLFMAVCRAQDSWVKCSELEARMARLEKIDLERPLITLFHLGAKKEGQDD
jgi:hypothetical protein